MCFFFYPDPVINWSFLSLENDHETETANGQTGHASIFKTTQQHPAFHTCSALRGSRGNFSFIHIFGSFLPLIAWIYI